MGRVFERLAGSLTVLVEPLGRYMNVVAASILTFMVFWVLTDVFLRFFFRAPIMGSLEWVRYMVAIVVFWGVAYCQLKKRMVRTDIFVSRFPKSVQAIIDSTTFIFGIVVVALIAWQTTLHSIGTFHTKEIPPGITSLPVWPVIGLAAFGAGVLGLVLIRDLFQSLADMWKTTRRPIMWFLIVMAVATLLIGAPAWLDLLGIKWSPTTAGLIGLSFLIALTILRMPIAFSMLFVGFIGFWYLVGFDQTMAGFKTIPYGTVATFIFSILPLFILMSALVRQSGIAQSQYTAAASWLGRLPGGFSLASVVACTTNSFASASSQANVAAIGSVAVTDMKRYSSSSRFTFGALASGGTLSLLIFPSIGLIIYGLLTEVSIGQLFMAGLIPGLILSAVFVAYILIAGLVRPQLAPRAQVPTGRQLGIGLLNMVPPLILGIIILFVIFVGLMTPTEAAAVAAFVAFILALIWTLVWGRSILSVLRKALDQTVQTTCMIVLIIIGVFILGRFIVMSQIPMLLSDWIISLEVSGYVILVLLFLFYIFLSCLIEPLTLMFIFLPIFYPTILSLGFDPIWFAVILMLFIGVGMVVPLAGNNLRIVQSLGGGLATKEIAIGAAPFVGLMIVVMGLLIAFPQLALFLPNLMGF